IFDFSNLRRPFYPIVRGWWMEEGGWEWDLRRRVERWYSLQKRYDRSYFFAYFDLDFRLFLLVRALISTLRSQSALKPATLPRLDSPLRQFAPPSPSSHHRLSHDPDQGNILTTFRLPISSY